MSRESILSMVRRLEGLADTLLDCDLRGMTSLSGQIKGTVQAINAEFRRNGIDPSNPDLAALGYREYDESNAQELVEILHNGAGWYRGLAERL